MQTLEIALDQRPPRSRPPEQRHGEDPQSTLRRLDLKSTCALVECAREGDSGALDALCTRYLPRLHRWAHGRLPVWARSALDTHDLVQETITHVIGRLRGFDARHDAAFQAYLRQSFLNRLRDEIRRARRRPAPDVLDTQNASPDPSPLDQAIGQETRLRYEQALRRLSPLDRKAIVVRVEKGRSYTEVADALGKPTLAAAYMAVSRALLRLAQEMSDNQA